MYDKHMNMMKDLPGKTGAVLPLPPELPFEVQYKVPLTCTIPIGPWASTIEVAIIATMRKMKIVFMPMLFTTFGVEIWLSN